MLPDQKERIILDAMLDDQCRKICKSIGKDNKIDAKYSFEDTLLCWNGRLYALESTRDRHMKTEHDSKVAGHFRRD